MNAELQSSSDGSNSPVLDDESLEELPTALGSRLVLSNFVAQRQAQAWVKAWRSRDLEGLAAFYADHCELSSPLIPVFMGEPSGRLCGKKQILEFWKVLFARQEKSRCDLFKVYRGIRTMTIIYRSARGKNALEQMEFDDEGRIIRSTSSFDQIG